MIKSIAVFCGSSLGSDPEYARQTRILGEGLAEKHIRLVYGGGRAGLMGILADTVLKLGGEVTGVIPVFLNTQERRHDQLTEQIEVGSMHERKAIIYSRSDAAIILPGGYGTLDEFFEIITWNQLTLHSKKIGLLNVLGFYDSLLEHLHQTEEKKFLHAPQLSQIIKAHDAGKLLDQLLAG